MDGFLARRPLLVALAVLALAVLAWAPDAVLGQGVFWAHDLRHHHMPWRAWAAGEWAAGRVPLWAPGVGNGFPLMADGQAGVFYAPTMLLFLALPPALALNASVLLHLGWAGLGGWRLGRALRLRPEAALVGGVAFAFSGFLTTHTVYLGMQNAAAWLPWALVAILQRRWPLLSVAVFMMVTAGHPQAAAFGLLLCGATTLWQRQVLSFATATGMGLLAASPQLLATIELSGLGLREGGVDALFANIGAMPVQELVGAVLPDAFGHDAPALVQETYYHRGEGYWGQGLNHWEMGFFLGVPAVLLGLAAPPRRAAFWWAVVGASALLMLGYTTPLWPLLRKLPGLDGFRFPARFALLLTVAWSVLAAMGAERLLDLPAAALRRRARLVAAGGLLLLLAFGAARGLLALGDGALRGALTARFSAEVEAPPPPPAIAEHPLREVLFPGPELEDPAKIPAKVERIVTDLARSTSPASPRVLWPVGMVLALAGLLTLRDRLGRHTTGLLLAALLYVDLHRFGAGYNARTPRAFVESTPELLAQVPAGGTDRLTVVDRRIDPALDVQIVTSSLGLLHGTRDVILTTPLLILRNEVLLWGAGLDVGDKGPQKWTRLLAHPELADLMGLRWMTSVHRPDDTALLAAGMRHVAATADGRVHLYENLEVQPTAWLTACVDVQAPEAVDADPVAFLRRLDPARPLVEVPQREDLGLRGCQPGAPSPGTATPIEDSPTRLRFQVQADRAALMVQRDTWYPGWVARVDGVPVPLYRTAFAFRGVPVPAGAHEVMLSYEPERVGAALRAMPWLLGIMGLALVGSWLRAAWARDPGGPAAARDDDPSAP